MQCGALTIKQMPPAKAVPTIFEPDHNVASPLI